MNTQRLKREIEQQTRNGRTSVYISISDLEELQGIQTQSNGRIYIDVSELEELIYKYEKNSFKRRLKVKGTPIAKINELKENYIQKER